MQLRTAHTKRGGGERRGYRLLFIDGFLESFTYGFLVLYCALSRPRKAARRVASSGVPGAAVAVPHCWRWHWMFARASWRCELRIGLRFFPGTSLSCWRRCQPGRTACAGVSCLPDAVSQPVGSICGRCDFARIRLWRVCGASIGLSLCVNEKKPAGQPISARLHLARGSRRGDGRGDPSRVMCRVACFSETGEGGVEEHEERGRVSSFSS